MTHHVFIDDTVIIKRKLEIPPACPKCKLKFELGETILRSPRLRPREETLLLSTLIVDDVTKMETVQVKNISQYGEHPNLLVELTCVRCRHRLGGMHSRQYVLAEMDALMAFKLRGLLYDSNVKDDHVRRKCFDETIGYHGDCIACNIEAEIGTEEVPHPVDGRLHTCDKVPP